MAERLEMLGLWRPVDVNDEEMMPNTDFLVCTAGGIVEIASWISGTSHWEVGEKTMRTAQDHAIWSCLVTPEFYMPLPEPPPFKREE